MKRIFSLWAVVFLLVPLCASADLKLLEVRDLSKDGIREVGALAWDEKRDLLYAVESKKQITLVSRRGKRVNVAVALEKGAHTLACDHQGKLWFDWGLTDLVCINPQTKEKTKTQREFDLFEIADCVFAGNKLFVMGIKRLRVINPVSGALVGEVPISLSSNTGKVVWCKNLCSDGKRTYILTTDFRLLTLSLSPNKTKWNISETKLDLGYDTPSDCVWWGAKKQIVVSITGTKPRIVSFSPQGKRLWTLHFGDPKLKGSITDPPLDPWALCVCNNALVVALSNKKQSLLATYSLQ